MGEKPHQCFEYEWEVFSKAVSFRRWKKAVYPAEVTTLQPANRTRTRHEQEWSRVDSSSTPVDDFVDPEVLAFRRHFDTRSPLDELVREGARRMLQEAIHADVDGFFDEY